MADLIIQEADLQATIDSIVAKCHAGAGTGQDGTNLHIAEDGATLEIRGKFIKASGVNSVVRTQTNAAGGGTLTRISTENGYVVTEVGSSTVGGHVVNTANTQDGHSIVENATDAAFDHVTEVLEGGQTQTVEDRTYEKVTLTENT